MAKNATFGNTPKASVVDFKYAGNLKKDRAKYSFPKRFMGFGVLSQSDCSNQDFDPVFELRLN